MPNAFYFMPDISGFSEFVNTTEIEHSIHIISELLEILIDTNPMDFKLVELEGDALFMYTTKQLQFEEIFEQTQQMMVAFHTHTKMYEHKRICNCGSCKTTHNLRLKFIVHYGDLNFIKVKDIIKPYGKDVIKTHRLLKNKVPINEYLLITSSVYDLYKHGLDPRWEEISQYYDLQEINYYFKDLNYIRSEIEIVDNQSKSEDLKVPQKSFQKIIESDIDRLYLLVSELKYRHLWDQEVKQINFDENKVNRMGTVHNCVLQFGSLNFETISKKANESLVYGERTKDMMFVKNFEYVLRLDKINDTRTQLTLELYIEFTRIGKVIKNNILKIITKMWTEKLEQLNLLAINSSVII